MLVYANYIELVGKNPALQVLRAVSGWFSDKLEQRITIRDIVHSGEFSGGTPRAWLRIDQAENESFKLYSWVLKHSDSSVTGRQWVTELGLRENEGGFAEFSCLIHTEEQSILVSEPVGANLPRIIRFIINNVRNEPDVNFVPGTIGSSIKRVGDSTDSYRGLLADIQADKREYPIVLVSPDNDGRYIVDPERLQNALFGLAQVVEVTEGFNSYEMEEILGRGYSAWAGALNIIRTPHRDGRIFSHLILSRDFPVECDTLHKKESFVLGRVSHNTNVPRQRHRIRPEGVRTLAVRQKLEQQSKSLAEKPDSSVRDELGMVYEELSSLTDQLDQVQLDKASVELTLLETEERYQELEKQLKTRVYNHSQRSAVVKDLPKDEEIIDELISLTSSTQAPTPEQSLEILAKVYPKRLVVLPTAIESAREVSDFLQSRRLLDMLNRLVTEYLPKYLENGDSGARSVFTNNEFAARESATVSSNRQYMKYRIFDYDGKEIEMAKHLKVGVADNPTATIRVHFEIDQASKRVVIGHCGLHLPLPGR